MTDDQAQSTEAEEAKLAAEYQKKGVSALYDAKKGFLSYDGMLKAYTDSDKVRYSLVKDVVCPKMVHHMDLTRIEQCPTEHTSGAFTHCLNDTILRIPWKHGSSCNLIIMLEYQSRNLRCMPSRILEYVSMLVRYFDKNTANLVNGVYPYILPVVIYTGEEKWTAPSDIYTMFGYRPEEAPDYLPRNGYELIDVRHMPQDGQPGDSLAHMVLNMVSSKNAVEGENNYIALSKKAAELDDIELNELVVRTARYMLSYFGVEEIPDFWSLEEAKAVVTKSTQQLVERLEQKGRQEGIQQTVASQSQHLISKLEHRFPDFPDSLKDRIRQVTDANMLIDLTACAVMANSPEEFARQMTV